MPIDASIYQNAKPIPISIPSPLDVAQSAMTLSQLGMHQQQMQRQFQAQNDMRQALMNNTDMSGNLDQTGYLSQLSKVNPMAGMDARTQLAQFNKQQAEAQTAQSAAAHAHLSVVIPAYQYLLGLPDDQAAQAYHGVVKQLADQGVPVQGAEPDFDRAKIQQEVAIGSKLKEQLDAQAAQAGIGKTQAETAEAWANAGAPAPMKIGAEELGKFNEDVNNASSRKTTGSLIEARTRADRITNLLNSGAPPGETQAQRITRLNQYMPQIGTEIGTSLAAIMQGGVPNEDLQKKLSPDTISSKIAEAEQKWRATPTAANQGALLDAYGDVASKLRDFSAGQLQQISDRARAAYPFANKYYGKQMDQIASQIQAPQSGAQIAAGGAQGQGGEGLIPSANASSKLPKGSIKPGEVRRGFVFNGGDPTDKRNWKKAAP